MGAVTNCSADISAHYLCRHGPARGHPRQDTTGGPLPIHTLSVTEGCRVCMCVVLYSTLDGLGLEVHAFRGSHAPRSQAKQHLAQRRMLCQGGRLRIGSIYALRSRGETNNIVGMLQLIQC
jgi:hypothetical protein